MEKSLEMWTPEEREAWRPKPKDNQHPLEFIVWELVSADQMLDVTNVALALAGAFVWNVHTAYSRVAADLLEFMTLQGKLIQRGNWVSAKAHWKGGPVFTLPPMPGEKDERSPASE